MVNPFSIEKVVNKLRKFGVEVMKIRQGEALVNDKEIDLEQLDQELHEDGFALVKEKDWKIIDETVNYLGEYLDLMGKQAELPHYLTYLNEKMGINAATLNKFFYSIKNIPIEDYYKILKIERVKEKILENKLPMAKIAYLFHYKDVEALGIEFKKVTGISLNDYQSLVLV